MVSDWDRDLAEARVAEAALERRRAERAALAVSQEATFGELLDGAAGRGVMVTVWTDDDSQPRRGWIESHGSALITMRTAAGTRHILARDRIVAHEPSPAESNGPSGSSPASSRRHDIDMAEMLAELRDRRTPVSVRSAGLVTVGVIDEVSDDVVELLTAEGRRRYVAVRSVTEVRLDAPRPSS